MIGEVPDCPDRLLRDHRNCDACDDYAVATRGAVDAARWIAWNRVTAALDRLAARRASSSGDSS